MTTTNRILLKITAATVVVIVVCTVMTYRMVLRSAELKATHHLEDYVAERARAQEADLRRVDQNLRMVREIFLKREAQPVATDVDEQWNHRNELYPDGAWRTRREDFDARQSSSTWVRAGTHVTASLKSRIIRTEDILNDFAPGWVDTFPSLYFIFPEQVNIGFDARIPNWVWDAKADYDTCAPAYYQEAAPEKNPEGHIIWGGSTREPVSQVPYVSVTLPIRNDDGFIGIVGHDIAVRDLMDNTARQGLPGMELCLFNRDGRLVAHPTLEKRILDSDGKFKLQDSSDETLKSLYAACLAAGPNQRISAGSVVDGRVQYAAARFQSPDWFLVGMMPGTQLREDAFRSARWVLWSGLISLGLVLGFFTIILRRQIAQPLAELARVTHQFSAGDTTARARVPRGGELGELAAAFNAMVESVEQRGADLQASEQRWRALVEQAPLSIQIFAPDGRTRLVNRAYEKFWGVPFAALTEYNVLDDAQLEANGTAPFLRRAFAGEVVSVPAARYDASLNPGVSSPVGEKWLSALLYPLLDDAGRVREVICIHEDITERKRADDEIRALNLTLEQRVAGRSAELLESEERFIKLFQFSPTPSVLTRADHGIAAANEAFLKTAGYTEAEVLNKTAEDLQLYAVPEQREEFARAIYECGRIRDKEQFLRTKNNDIRTILVSAELLELGGMPHVLTAGLDITERKQAEVETTKALASEKELSELKTNFVSMVSHEFRTPLGVIQSAADVLHRYLDRLSAEERREHLDMIFRSTRSLSHLVDSALLLGRVEDGRMRYQPVPLDFPRLCHEIADEVRSATAAKCPVEISMEGDLEDARSDADLLRHILTNLLGNAVKYSEPDSPVRLSISRNGADVIITIRDRGIGIPDIDRVRLFTSFARGSNVGLRPGSGLGLLIVKRCIDLHQGGIEIQSQYGEGTTVIVRLPLFQTPKTIP